MHAWSAHQQYIFCIHPKIFFHKKNMTAYQQHELARTSRPIGEWRLGSFTNASKQRRGKGMVKETIPASRASGRGAEGMESREPHHCVCGERVTSFWELQCVPSSCLFIYIYNIFLPCPMSVAASIHEREREREVWALQTPKALCTHGDQWCSSSSKKHTHHGTH